MTFRGQMELSKQKEQSLAVGISRGLLQFRLMAIILGEFELIWERLQLKNLGNFSLNLFGPSPTGVNGVF